MLKKHCTDIAKYLIYTNLSYGLSTKAQEASVYSGQI